MATTHRSEDLITEARGPLRHSEDSEHCSVCYGSCGAWPGERVGDVEDLIARLADALEVAEARATEAEADRDEFKRLFAECHPIHLDGVQRAHVAEKELRDRELHHFEVEQELAAALAVIEKARGAVKRGSLMDPMPTRLPASTVIQAEVWWQSWHLQADAAWRRNMTEALSSVPADVLRERDAEKWDEGFNAGVNHDLGDWENAPGIISNPYRTEEEN